MPPTFDQLSTFGSLVFDAVGDSLPPGAPETAAISTYLENLTKIYNLLAQTHNEVLAVTDRVTTAGSLAEINQDLQELRDTNLRNTFKARKWCDEFRALGTNLRDLPPRIESALPQAYRNQWDEFCQTLEDGEFEVARLYDQAMPQLRLAALNASPSGLDAVKKDIASIAQQMTLQRQKFALLAAQADDARARLQ